MISAQNTMNRSVIITCAVTGSGDATKAGAASRDPTLYPEVVDRIRIVA